MGSDGEQVSRSVLRRVSGTDEARALPSRTSNPPNKIEKKQWAKENAPILLKHLETLATELPLYRDLLSIIAEYAITWIDV